MKESGASWQKRNALKKGHCIATSQQCIFPEAFCILRFHCMYIIMSYVSITSFQICEWLYSLLSSRTTQQRWQWRQRWVLRRETVKQTLLEYYDWLYKELWCPIYTILWFQNRLKQAQNLDLILSYGCSKMQVRGRSPGYFDFWHHLNKLIVSFYKWFDQQKVIDASVCIYTYRSSTLTRTRGSTVAGHQQQFKGVQIYQRGAVSPINTFAYESYVSFYPYTCCYSIKV